MKLVSLLIKVSIYPTGLPLSFESPVTLFSTPLANLLLGGWIINNNNRQFHPWHEGKIKHTQLQQVLRVMRPLMTALAQMTIICWRFYGQTNDTNPSKYIFSESLRIVDYERIFITMKKVKVFWI